MARLRILLEVHAEAEEALFSPRLLGAGEGATGADGPVEETKDAIRDHDDIRDGIAQVARHRAGDDEWWQAVAATRQANSDHMAEEERAALADFRRHASLEARHDLAVAFAAFEADHAAGIASRDEDPRRSVEQHT